MWKQLFPIKNIMVIVIRTMLLIKYVLTLIIEVLFIEVLIIEVLFIEQIKI